MDYMIKDSKFGKNNEKCLYLQIEFKGRKHVIFTGSIVLLEMIQKVPKSDFPFKTIIIKEDEHFEFS